MYEGLLKWKRKAGKSTGIRDILFDAIIANGRRDVVDDFKNHFGGNYNACHSDVINIQNKNISF